MSSCTRCRKQFDYGLRKNMCRTCYSNNRNRQIAFGRWVPGEIDASDTYIRLVTFRAMGMNPRQIQRAVGISQTVYNRILRDAAKGDAKVDPITAKKVLAVPVPRSVGEVIAGARGGEFVPALGARRRLQSLVAARWPMIDLAAELGVRRSEIDRLIHRNSQIRAYRHHEVVALFNRLQFQQGRSAEAAEYARERNWPLPFQWEDDQLDEPDARPAAGSRRRIRAAS
jgi:hypothetical protein